MEKTGEGKRHILIKSDKLLFEIAKAFGQSEVEQLANILLKNCNTLGDVFPNGLDVCKVDTPMSKAHAVLKTWYGPRRYACGVSMQTHSKIVAEPVNWLFPWEFFSQLHQCHLCHRIETTPQPTYKRSGGQQKEALDVMVRGAIIGKFQTYLDVGLVGCCSDDKVEFIYFVMESADDPRFSSLHLVVFKAHGIHCLGEHIMETIIVILRCKSLCSHLAVGPCHFTICTMSSLGGEDVGRDAGALQHCYRTVCLLLNPSQEEPVHFQCESFLTSLKEQLACVPDGEVLLVLWLEEEGNFTMIMRDDRMSAMKQDLYCYICWPLKLTSNKCYYEVENDDSESCADVHCGSLLHFLTKGVSTMIGPALLNEVKHCFVLPFNGRHRRCVFAESRYALLDQLIRNFCGCKQTTLESLLTSEKKWILDHCLMFFNTEHGMVVFPNSVLERVSCVMSEASEQSAATKTSNSVREVWDPPLYVNVHNRHTNDKLIECIFQSFKSDGIEGSQRVQASRTLSSRLLPNIGHYLYMGDRSLTGTLIQLQHVQEPFSVRQDLRSAIQRSVQEHALRYNSPTPQTSPARDRYQDVPFTHGNNGQLMLAGQDCDIRPACFSSSQTGLHFAAREGHTGTCSVLLANGADVYAVDNSRTRESTWYSLKNAVAGVCKGPSTTDLVGAVRHETVQNVAMMVELNFSTCAGDGVDIIPFTKEGSFGEAIEEGCQRRRSDQCQYGSTTQNCDVHKTLGLQEEVDMPAGSSVDKSNLPHFGLINLCTWPFPFRAVDREMAELLPILLDSFGRGHSMFLDRFLENVSVYSETVLLVIERSLLDLQDQNTCYAQCMKYLRVSLLSTIVANDALRGDHPRREGESSAPQKPLGEEAAEKYTRKDFEKEQIFHQAEREKRQLINIACMGALNPEEEGRPILKVLIDQLAEFTGMHGVLRLVPLEENFTRATLIEGYKAVGKWLHENGCDVDIAVTCVLTGELLGDDASQEAVLRATERVRSCVNVAHRRVLDCLYQLSQAHIRVAQTKKSGFAYSANEIQMHSKKSQRFQEALVSLASSIDPTTKYNCLLGIGQCNSLLEQYASALDAYEHCSDTASEDENPTMHYYIVEGQLGCGEVHLLLEQYSKAVDKFRDALKSCDRLHGNESSIIALKVKVLNKIGSVQRTLGRVDVAVETHLRALSLAKDIDSAVGIANSACPLGNIYQSMGNPQQSCKYYQQQYIAAKRTGDYSMMTWAAGNLGNGKLAVRDMAEAARYLEEALNLAEKLHDPIEIGRASNNLGNIHLARREFEQALRLFRKACQTAIDTQDHTGQMRACGNIGNIYMSLNQPVIAHEWYRLAFSLSHQTGDEVSEGNAHYNIGRACLACYEKDKKDGLPVGEHLLDDAERHFLNSAQIFNGLYEDIGTGESGEVLKVSLFHNNVKVFRQLQNIHTLRGNYEKALEFAERGRAMTFSDFMQQRLECKMAGLNMQLSKVPTPLSAENIKELVAKQSAVVLIYAICRGQLHIWHIDPHRNGKVTFRTKTIARDEKATTAETEQKLRREVLSVLHTIVRPELLFMQSNGDLDEDMPTRLAALYDKLIGPVRDLLPEPSTGQEIVIVPCSILFNVPFCALFDRHSSTYLSQLYPLRVIPTCRLLDVPRPVTVLRSPYDDINVDGSPQALIVGNPEIPCLTLPNNELWRPCSLKHAQQEALCVARVCGTVPLLGEKASKQAVLRRMSTADVIHLASHGTSDGSIMLAPDGDTSGLLPDELYAACALTPSDINHVQLKASLVVLSACDSGHGARTAEGPMGLARAFLVAGAQAVVVSVVPVRDQPTKILMRAFYHLLQFGWTASLALQYAMHQVSVFMRYTAPHNWGGFQLLGRDVCINLPAIRLQALPFHWRHFAPCTTGSDLPLTFPRHDVFEEIFHLWFGESRTVHQRWTNAIGLSGGKGLGKTVTAVVVASYFKQQFPDKEVVWLSATSEASLLLSFQLARKQLQLRDNELSATEAVMNWLCDNATCTGWLLILDGVDDLSVGKCLPSCLLTSPSEQAGRVLQHCYVLATSPCPLLAEVTSRWVDIPLRSLDWEQSVEMLLHLTSSSFPAPELSRGDKVHISLVCRPKVVSGLPAVIDGLAALIDQGRVVSFTDLHRQLPSVQDEDPVPIVSPSSVLSLPLWPLLPEDRSSQSGWSSFTEARSTEAFSEGQAASSVQTAHGDSLQMYSAREGLEPQRNVVGVHPLTASWAAGKEKTHDKGASPQQMTRLVRRTFGNGSLQSHSKLQGDNLSHPGSEIPVAVLAGHSSFDVDETDGHILPNQAEDGRLLVSSVVAISGRATKPMDIGDKHRVGLVHLLKTDERDSDVLEIESAARMPAWKKGSILQRICSYLLYGRLRWFPHDILAAVQADLQEGLPECEWVFKPHQGVSSVSEGAAAVGDTSASAVSWSDVETANNPLREWLLAVRDAIGRLPLPLDFVIESALDAVAHSESPDVPPPMTRRASEGSVLAWLSLLGMIDILSVNNAYTASQINTSEFDLEDAMHASSTYEVSKYTIPFKKLSRPDKEKRLAALSLVAERLRDILHNEQTLYAKLKHGDIQHLLLAAMDLCEQVTKVTPPVPTDFAVMIGNLCDVLARLLSSLPGFDDICSTLIDEVMPRVRAVLSQGCDMAEFIERKRAIRQCQVVFKKAQAKHTSPFRVQVVGCAHLNILLFSNSYHPLCYPWSVMESSSRGARSTSVQRSAVTTHFQLAESFTDSVLKQRNHLCRFCAWRDDAVNKVLFSKSHVYHFLEALSVAEHVLRALQALHNDKNVISMGYWSVSADGVLVGRDRVQLVVIDSDLIGGCATFKMAGDKDDMAADLHDFGALMKDLVKLVKDDERESYKEHVDRAFSLADTCLKADADHLESAHFAELLRNEVFRPLWQTPEDHRRFNSFIEEYKVTSKT